MEKGSEIILSELKDYIVKNNDELMVQVNKLINQSSCKSIPVGFVYVQFPNCLAPSALGMMGTWSEITSDYAGCFFRANGGNSEAFGTKQSDLVKSHTHTWSGSASHNHIGGAGFFYSGFSAIYGLASPASVSMGVQAQSGQTFRYFPYTNTVTVSLSGTTSSNNSTATENRPTNYSIKIWKRIS
jgi:hypothetical protein